MASYWQLCAATYKTQMIHSKTSRNISKYIKQLALDMRMLEVIGVASIKQSLRCVMKCVHIQVKSP